MPETETEWVLISNNEPLSHGDRIRMYYSIIGPTYVMAAQIASIEKKLESDPRFTLTRTSMPSEGGWVHDIWFEILVKKPSPQAPQIQQAALHVGIIHALILSAFGAGSQRDHQGNRLDGSKDRGGRDSWSDRD